MSSGRMSFRLSMHQRLLEQTMMHDCGIQPRFYSSTTWKFHCLNFHGPFEAIDLSMDVFNTLMINYDGGGLAQQLVKVLRNGTLDYTNMGTALVIT